MQIHVYLPQKYTGQNRTNMIACNKSTSLINLQIVPKCLFFIIILTELSFEVKGLFKIVQQLNNFELIGSAFSASVR
ncbi:MAG TPA: hypothetical protein DHU74_05680 [Clostridiales bacterium]|nr:hypothetical protein [Clostridiales bacterium]